MSVYSFMLAYQVIFQQATLSRMQYRSQATGTDWQGSTAQSSWSVRDPLCARANAHRSL